MKAIFLTGALLWPGMARPSSGTVRCDVADGVYGGPITVTLTGDVPSAEIRFTLDGGAPDRSSALYDRPLSIDRTRVLRAQAFLGSEPRSAVVTRTFVIGERPSLPVLSVATAPANLWDPDTGIFAHPLEQGREWEREAHVTLIEDGGNVPFSIPAGLRVHGASSRRRAKLSMRLYFRSEYDAGRLDGRLFPMKPVDRFDRLVLHSGSSDQPGAGGTLLRDVVTAALLHEAGGIASAFRPVNVYLNGEYWGLYWIREYLDDHFLAGNFAIEDADLLHDHDVRAGDALFWEATERFFESHAFHDDAEVARAEELYVDVPNLVDYQIVEIYTANWDWPHHNVDRFSDREGPRPWRWMLWDVDNGWLPGLVEHNSLAWAIRDRPRPDLGFHGTDHEEWVQSTLILRRLVQNEGFRQRFASRFADLLNTSMSPASLRARIDAWRAVLGPDIERELDRWGDLDRPRWERAVDQMIGFAERRPARLREDLARELGLGGTATLTVEPPAGGEGEVAVNSITLAAFPWTGAYFEDVPVTLEARPAPGYGFAGWDDPELPGQPVITIDLAGDRRVRVRFSPQAAPLGSPATRPLAVAPNPFRPDAGEATTVRFDSPGAGIADLAIFEPTGRELRVLSTGPLPPGPHAASWDGRAESGEPAPAGVYVVRLVLPGTAASLSGKLVVLR